MSHDILVTAKQLEEWVSADKCIVADCRFDLADPAKGHQDYLDGHIPGAVHVHLDNDLSSPVRIDSGRHPLPEAPAFASFLASLGWSSDKLLVVHDGSSNAFSLRLWWLMQYFGLPAAALDGGLAAWVTAGFPLQQGRVEREPSAAPVLTPRPHMNVLVAEVEEALHSELMVLVDARAPERFSGEIEPLDSAAGHIPGALNRPLGLNVQADGRFKEPAQLKTEFEALLQGRDPAAVVNYCGSGVTACHNHFSMRLAGLEPGRVYSGSWSEWIRSEQRPHETGR